jgi:hypothetical protein
MNEKHPTWTRKRIGRDRVHWVAYDDRAGSADRIIIDQGYAASLVEADAAARAALAEAGLYGARRTATGLAASGRAAGPEARRRAGSGADRGWSRPRRYVFSRQTDQDGTTHILAHLVLRENPRKVHVTLRTCWTGQLGTEDERWEEDEPVIALDRARLDRDGSVYSTRLPHSAVYRSREEAADGLDLAEDAAFAVLGLRPPCTLDDIKAAYRRRALEAHPDRGGAPGDFQAVEDAYRQLSRAARVPS